MNRLFLLTPLMTAFAIPATAQTILSLTATGSVSAAPDQAVAHFDVQSTEPNAAKAQANVNRVVAKALEAAHAVAGITATTSNYNTYQVVPEHQTTPAFTAEQSLTLVEPAKGGVPDAAFTNLLANLQNEGLLLTGLGGNLSAAGTQKLQKEAIHQALEHLHEDAQSIAQDLHKKVSSLQSLTIGQNNGIQYPVGPRMMAMAVSAPPPQSAPDNVDITAQVSAKIELTPDN